MKISVIVPFYKGNQYLNRLFASIESVYKATKEKVDYEILIVNDSPDVPVLLPETELNVTLIQNEQNLGIQGTRINGLSHASGDWILFLDQDDELVVDGFKKQLKLTKNADVVVGNGIYRLGRFNKQVFSNLTAMKYLIQERRFIEIRNLIPSPGECLIRREKISDLWKQNQMHHNGADDWLLWLLLFKEKAVFVCNEQIVYIHNDTEGENLSADYDKMRISSMEMVKILKKYNVLNPYELQKLSMAIDFKYYQDTKQLTLGRLIRYAGAIKDNVRYRLTLDSCKRKG